MAATPDLQDDGGGTFRAGAGFVRPGPATLAAFAEAAPDGMIAFDQRGRVEWVNAQAERMFGHRRADITGLQIESLFPEPSLGRRKDGSRFPIETAQTTIDGPKGPLTLVVVYQGRGRLATDRAHTENDIVIHQRAETALQRSEERWRAVFQHSVIGIGVVDVEGRIKPNNALVQMLGYTEEELNQIRLIELTHEDDRPETRRLVRQLMSSELPSFRLEKRYRRKDGRVIWADTTVSFVPRAERMEPFFLWVLEDITKRKETGEALERSEALWRAVFENSAVGITLADREGRPLAMNPALERILGYSHAELRGRSFLELTHDEDVAETRARLGELLAGRRSQYQSQKRYRRKDGRSIWVVSSVSAVMGPDGRPEFVIGVSEDVTQRKQAEESLQQSEEQYRLVVETASDAVVSVDETGRILYANPATARVFGHEISQLIGQPLTMLMPESLRARHEGGFERYLATRQRRINWRGTELIGLRSSGEQFPIEVSFGEVQRNGRQIFTGFIRDITEQKHAEALRVAHARRSLVRADISVALAGKSSLGQILQTCAESVVRHLDAAFTRIWTLDEAHDLLELQVSAGMYTHLDGPSSRIPVGSLEIGWIARGKQPLLTNEVAGDQRIGDREWTKREGLVAFAGYPLVVGDHVVGVLSTFSRAPLSEGTLEVLAAVAESIAHGIDLKRAEAALQRAQTELARVTRVTTMGEMAASIAHEVNQPLGAIAANADACLRWLEREPPNLEEARRTVEHIASDATRASDIIAGIRALVKRTASQHTTFDVGDVVREVLALARGDIVRHGILVETTLEEHLPAVHGDRVQLQQVVLNLVINGIEAVSDVPDGPRELRIRLQRVEVDGRAGVRVRVEDSGVGFAVADGERLFEAFYTTKQQGLGMGLSISRSIVEAHGGALSATPGIARGAAFEFTLPSPPAPGS